MIELQQGKNQKYVIRLQQRKIKKICNWVATEKNQKYVMKLQYSKSQKYVTE